jgi:hypothetical protein
LSTLATAFWCRAVKRDFILVAILIAAIIGLAMWFTRTYEWRTEETDVGLQGEALRNDLLAAQRFLEKTGSTVTNVPGVQEITEMPARTDVVVVPTQRYDFSRERTERFRKWIEAGGHLIVTARRFKRKSSQHTDPLLDPLGVKFADAEDDNESENPQSETSDKTTDTTDGDSDEKTTNAGTDTETAINTTAGTGTDSNSGADADGDTDIDTDAVVVKIDDESELLRVRFDPRQSLEVMGETEPDWYVADEESIYLVEFRIGDGWLTIVNDFDFMTNDEIRDNDHAAFLWRLVHIDANRGTVWFIHRDDMPALSDLIWQNFKPIVIVICVILLAWLWSASRRFGPLLADPQPVRRSLREHIRASGYFIWKAQQRTQLLRSVQRALHTEIETLHPGWSQLDDAALHKRLAELTGMPIEVIQAALEADNVANETSFINYVDTLETIRKKL